jgi:xylulose-5-phosphate/fructose-6-phosphate phosphoketolase
VAEIADFSPKNDQRMSANQHANGGLLLDDLSLPDFKKYALDVVKPAVALGEATKVLGTFPRDVIVRNPNTFRLFGPDETTSNRLGAVFEKTDRTWVAQTTSLDDHLSAEGRVMEVLSEHLCQGWLEGYLLTGQEVW